MGLFSEIGSFVSDVCSEVGSSSALSKLDLDLDEEISEIGSVIGSFIAPFKPDLDLDEKRRQMDAMIEKQNKKMKNLSLNDKYKLDDSKEFFAKLGKGKR